MDNYKTAGKFILIKPETYFGVDFFIGGFAYFQGWS